MNNHFLNFVRHALKFVQNVWTTILHTTIRVNILRKFSKIFFEQPELVVLNLHRLREGGPMVKQKPTLERWI